VLCKKEALWQACPDFSGLWGFWDGSSHCRSVCCGQTNQHSESFFGWNRCSVLWTEDEKDHPDCSQQPVQKPDSVMACGCISALGKGHLLYCDGSISSELNMLPSSPHLFKEHPCIFQQDSNKPFSANITKAWVQEKRARVLNWPACSPALSPTENVWRILKRKRKCKPPELCAITVPVYSMLRT